MGLVDLDINLTEQQRILRDEARRFFMNVFRPASIKLDKLANPEDVIAKDSILWDVMSQAYKIGYHKRTFAEEFGGLGMRDPLASSLIAEEMGYAAADLAISLSVASFPFGFAALSPNAELRKLVRQFCEDTEVKYIGCWAITEPEHGSDWIYFNSENSRDAKAVPQVRARKKGDEYIISGQKAAWVSNGTIASHAGLFVGIEPCEGIENCGVAVVPLDLPGVSKGKPLNKLGQRALNQGEIFFDDVKIPADYMIFSGPAVYKLVINNTLAGANANMGSTFAGTARSALDEAITYASQRIQGGKPIIEHQSVKERLFDMFMQVEAARSFSRRVILYNAQARTPALHYSIASKIMSTEAAFKVASMAVQIFGGFGLSKDFVIEKIFRDARASTIEDGVNETLALTGAELLKP
jgi:alkylation response protein AidB-like acyl-CoA dehydrogenase